MTDRLRLAAVQSPVSCDPEANGTAVRELISTAHEHGARLVQFPEGAISGYPGTPAARRELAGWQVDWDAVRDELERTADLAAQLGVWVVIGGNHRLNPPHRPHNSLYIISDSGLVGRYDKRLLSHTEFTNWYTPGFEPLVFEVDGFRFGCALCVEVSYPELFGAYAALDVDCVLFSSYSDDPIFDVLARAHAAANGLWISVSVPARLSTAMSAGVIGPHGYWLAMCPTDGEPAMTCVDLDQTDRDLDIALHKARPWRAVARHGELYRSAQVRDHRSTDKTSF